MDLTNSSELIRNFFETSNLGLRKREISMVWSAVFLFRLLSRLLRSYKLPYQRAFCSTWKRWGCQTGWVRSIGPLRMLTHVRLFVFLILNLCFADNQITNSSDSFTNLNSESTFFNEYLLWFLIQLANWEKENWFGPTLFQLLKLRKIREANWWKHLMNSLKVLVIKWLGVLLTFYLFYERLTETIQNSIQKHSTHW